MKFIRYIILSFFVLLPWQITYSQGFDWIKSWRMPSESPDVFFGVYSGYGMNTEYVTTESFSKVLDCCGFSNGSGSDLRIGFTGEYWLQGDFSLQAQLGFGLTSASFNASIQDSILHLDPSTSLYLPVLLEREYILQSKIQSLELAMIAKKRLFESHFSIAFGISGAITLPSDSMHSLEMRVNIPNKELGRSSYNPSDMVRDIQVSSFLFKPLIRFEYDVQFANQTYIKPYIQTDLTVNSRTFGSNSWRTLTVLGGISYLFSY